MAELVWTKVMCPVDFSDESRAALKVGIDLARRFGAELILMHAENPGTRLQAQSATAGQIEDWKREAESQGASRTRTVSGLGEPQTAIIDVSSREGVSLIVMGTHGRTGRDRSLMGSVAENVVRRSRIPVLTVHADWSAVSV